MIELSYLIFNAICGKERWFKRGFEEACRCLRMSLSHIHISYDQMTVALAVYGNEVTLILLNM